MSKKINHGAVWSIGSQFVNYSLSLVFTAILARLVLPEHYGLFNMVSTVTAFFMIFADGGLAWSIIQKKEISDAAVSNLFWINAGLGGLMALMCLLIAPLLANFYGYDELANLTAIMSINFILTGLTVPGTAWLKRQLKLREIAVINILALLAAGVGGVYAAYAGFGYWSLAVQTLIKGIITLLGTLAIAKMPLQFYCSKTPTMDMVKFSGGLLGFGAVNYFSRNLDSILIAKTLGAEELAFYEKAYFIMTLPSMLTTGALTGLMVSVLAKHQDNTVLFHLYYKRALRLIALFCFSIAGYFLVFPQDIILLLYGNRWNNAIPLLQILSIAGITQPLYNTMGWLFTAKGKSKPMFYWGIISAIILSAGFFIGVKWGSVGVAWSYSLVMGIILSFSALAFAHYIAGISLLKTIIFLTPVTIISILSLTLTWWLSINYLSDFGLLLNIFVRISLIIISTLLLLITFYRTNVIGLIKISE
ncbi:lipopolysaccharide biosynthesis protein [Methylobacter sp. sgz302048]|uniref:lipopolysaccharide biosynthesis protein n=1 Tax=Methylobacter sp. sgz302048 TaxID=3455945 RepID=UPI003F9FF81C